MNTTIPLVHGLFTLSAAWPEGELQKPLVILAILGFPAYWLLVSGRVLVWLFQRGARGGDDVVALNPTTSLLVFAGITLLLLALTNLLFLSVWSVVRRVHPR